MLQANPVTIHDVEICHVDRHCIAFDCRGGFFQIIESEIGFKAARYKTNTTPEWVTDHGTPDHTFQTSGRTEFIPDDLTNEDYTLYVLEHLSKWQIVPE